MTLPIAFVAYPSSDSTLARIVRQAAHRANALAYAVRYEPWEFNDIPGQFVVSPILERIAESTFIVADVTYLNLNVVYEIGFAIGTGKRAFLIRSKHIPGDRELARQVGIFDTLGYQEYEDEEDLFRRLTSHIDPTQLPLNKKIDSKAPIYIVEPPQKGDAATIMVARIKKARYRYRSFNPTEDSRLSALDAIRQVSASAGVVVGLYKDASGWAAIHNTRSAFVAGLAHGMDCPALILCPSGFDVPLDIRDDAKSYTRAEDIAEFIAEFVPEIADRLQQTESSPALPATALQGLQMGDPTAENEMTTLGSYFLTTDQYGRALRGEVNLAVGRKGSGKTALFIQVRDKIRADKRNVVVDLKPEGYQLIKLKENILPFVTEGSRQHLITAFWEYLILLEVAYKLLEKDKITHKFNHEIHDLYRELETTYSSDSISSEGDFSERLAALSQKISEEFQSRYGSRASTQLSLEEVTTLLYAHDIRALRSIISKYLERKQSVWVLFDNLDKGWSTGGVDAIDSVALRCLIDAGRKIEREMQKAEHRFRCIVFVRNDVYENVMAHSSDYGKEMRAVLDWSDPDLLREMLRLRLISALKLPPTTRFEQVWGRVCISHYKGEETSTFMIDRSLMRPRNLLKIFNYSRGFANNFSRPQIDAPDIEKGLLVYSQDLLVELGHELVDIAPGAKDLMYYFMAAKSEMSLDDVHSILQSADVDEADFSYVMDFLIYYGILGLRHEGADSYIFNVNYDPKVLQIRAQLSSDSIQYVLNPAFWPALGIA